MIKEIEEQLANLIEDSMKKGKFLRIRLSIKKDNKNITDLVDRVFPRCQKNNIDNFAKKQIEKMICEFGIENETLICFLQKSKNEIEILEVTQNEYGLKIKK